MTDFFITLFANSVITSVAAIVLVLLSRLLYSKTLPKFRHVCWLLVALCFLLPFRPALFAVTLPESNVVHIPDDYLPGEEYIFVALTAQEKAVNTDFLIIVWLLGFFLFLAFFIVSHRRFLRSVKRLSVPVNDGRIDILVSICRKIGLKQNVRLCICPIVHTPIVTGFFRPVIYLPAQDIGAEELRFMLLHETLHIKRGDFWSKLLSLFIVAIHWFNPLAYLVNRNISTESELACDAAVLKYINIGERFQYGETVLHAARRSLGKASVVSAFSDGGENLKKRLSAIVEQKSPRRWVAVLCASAVLACIFMAGMIGYIHDVPKCSRENRNQYAVCRHESVLTFNLHGKEKSYRITVAGLAPDECYYFVPNHLIRREYIYDHVKQDQEAICFITVKP